MRSLFKPEELDLRLLSEELSRVHDTFNASNYLKHSIFDLSATPDEVLQWYFARDPYIDSDTVFLNTVISHEQDTEPAEIVINDFINEPTYTLIGGTLLAASVLIPDAFTPEDPAERKDIFTRDYEDCIRFNEIDYPYEPTPAQALLLTCVAKASNVYEIDEADAENVFIAAEMLANGAAGREGMKKVTNISELDSWFNGVARRLANKLYSMVADFSLENSWKRDLSDDTRMLGLTSSMYIAERSMGASMEMLSAGNREGLDRADHDCLYLVTRLYNTLFHGDCGLEQRLKTPGVKGPIHEIVWFIDSYVLRRMHPDRYANIRMNPSYLRDDAPEVGYPRLNRGYDFVVNNGEADDYVQLKSGSSKTEYHPAITELEEGNFQDIQSNGKRLRRKLELYQKWLVEGCNPDMIPTLEDCILPTAKEEMDAMTTLTESRRKVIADLLFGLVGVSVADIGTDVAVKERNKKIMRAALNKRRR